MPTHARPIPLILALVLSAGRGVAQTPAARDSLAGRTPAECLQGATAARTRMVMQARSSGAPVDVNRIVAESRRLAATCAARFDVATIATDQLESLASLYLFVHDTALARRATDRLLAAPGLTARQRGEACLAAMRAAIAAADPFAGPVPAAEDLARRTDAFPDSLADLTLAAHQLLLEQYEYGDVDDGIRAHARAVLDIVARLRREGVPPPAAARPVLVQAYLSLARASADFLHPDSALAVLDEGAAALGPDSAAQRALAASRALYALVGTRAAPVVAQHWINAPDTLTAVPVGGGRVTLIQFTAHWCAPCRNSYPGFKRIGTRFAGRAFEALLVTDLYGVFEGKPVTPGEELAADRTYYAERWAIPFRVAIVTGPQTDGQTAVDEAYRVNGYPQVVVVDKRGVIRQIVSGWDRGNEDRLTGLIEQLEREPAS